MLLYMLLLLWEKSGGRRNSRNLATPAQSSRYHLASQDGRGSHRQPEHALTGQCLRNDAPSGTYKCTVSVMWMWTTPIRKTSLHLGPCVR